MSSKLNLCVFFLLKLSSYIFSLFIFFLYLFVCFLGVFCCFFCLFVCLFICFFSCFKFLVCFTWIFVSPFLSQLFKMFAGSFQEIAFKKYKWNLRIILRRKIKQTNKQTNQKTIAFVCFVCFSCIFLLFFLLLYFVFNSLLLQILSGIFFHIYLLTYYIPLLYFLNSHPFLTFFLSSSFIG